MYGDPGDSHISIKNEALPTLKACSLDFCRRLIHLDLSMNKIQTIDGYFECANLRTLILTDNLIREISPRMLAKLPSLQVLNLDMNQISKLEHLQNNTDLLDLSVM
jgi:Leucine-rich repeat (LRR) protein